MSSTLREAAQQALAFTMRDFASLRDFEAAKAVLHDNLRAALAEHTPPPAKNFADVLAIERAAAESNPSDAYMVGFYNGMALMDANYHDTDYAPISVAPTAWPAPQQEVQEPAAWLDKEINCAYMPEELDGGAADDLGLVPLYTASPKQAEPVQHYASIPGTNVRVRLQPEPVQEPVAQVHPNHLKPTDDGKPWCRVVALYSGDHNGDLLNGENYRVKLYTAPPQRKPLGDLTIADIYVKWDATPGASMADFARAIERSHGIGEEK